MDGGRNDVLPEPICPENERVLLDLLRRKMMGPRCRCCTGGVLLARYTLGRRWAGAFMNPVELPDAGLVAKVPWSSAAAGPSPLAGGRSAV